MKLLVDANIFLAVILNEPEKAGIIKLTKDCELISPEILPYEIGNALSAMFRRDRLSESQIHTCFDIFKKIPLRLVPVDIEKSLQIVSKHNIYAYDSYYLEVASRLNLKLLSLDQKMVNVAQSIEINTVEVENENI